MRTTDRYAPDGPGGFYDRKTACEIVIENWVAVRRCSWTSFINILGCLWAVIWAVITTVIAVVITVLALIYVIYNIVAFVAAL